MNPININHPSANRRLILAGLSALLALSVGFAGSGVIGVMAGASFLAPRAQPLPQTKPPTDISVSPLIAAGSGFTYQGRLSQAGNPSNGLYDFVFTLYDAAAGGNQVGSPITLTNQTVTGGLFNVELDFGSAAFLGDARWLEIAVRPAGGGAYSILLPRQPLTPAPYAQSVPWFGVSGKPAPYSPLRAANVATNVDAGGQVGFNTSVTIGADGLGLISYHDSTNLDLKVAHCNDVACTSSTATTLDSAGGVGFDTSITIGRDGLGLISYYDQTNGDLKVAHCENAACTSATITALDTTGFVGADSSITIAPSGLALISYYDLTNTNLKVIYCTNIACSSAATGFTIDSTGNVGEYTSITIGTDGLGLISYYDLTNSDLKTAHCNNVTCTSATLTTLDSTGVVGQYTSVTLGGDGYGLISYHNATLGDLKVAHCTNVNCSFADIIDLDTTNTVGLYTSIALGADGLGLISYYDQSFGDLKMAHCGNISCTDATVAALDSVNSVGQYNSVAIGTDGLGLISYYDNTAGDLKVLHCGSPFCVSYAHNR